MTATSQQQNKLKTNNVNSNVNSSSSGCSSVCSTSSKIKPASTKRKHLLDVRKNQYFLDKPPVNIMCNNNDSFKARTLLPLIKNRLKYPKNSKQIINYDEDNDDFEENEDEISQYHFCQFDASQFGQTLYRQHQQHHNHEYIISNYDFNKQKATFSEKDKRYLLLKLALPVPPPVVPPINFDRITSTIPSNVVENYDQGSYLFTVPNSTKNSFKANSTIKDDGTVDILGKARPIVPPPPPPPPPRRGTRLHVLAHAHAQKSERQNSVGINSGLEHKKTTSGIKEEADIGESRVCLGGKEERSEQTEDSFIDNFNNNKQLTTNQTQGKKKKIKIKRKTNNCKPRRKQGVILLEDTKCDGKNYYNDDKCQVDIRESLSSLFIKKRDDTSEFVDTNNCQNWSRIELKGKQKVYSSESRRQFGKQNTLCSQVHGLNLICQSNVGSIVGCQRCSSLDKISSSEINERQSRQVGKNLSLSVSSSELELSVLTTRKTLMTGEEDESQNEEYHKQTQRIPIISNNDDKHYVKTKNLESKDLKNSIVSFEKVTYLSGKKKIEKSIKTGELKETNQRDKQISSLKGKFNLN